jgi:hypothetical protein
MSILCSEICYFQDFVLEIALMLFPICCVKILFFI